MELYPVYSLFKYKSYNLYFENSNDEMYKDSIEGILPRKKIRVRNYPESKNLSFYLEMKISSVEGRYKTSKVIEEHKFTEIKKDIMDTMILVNFTMQIDANVNVAKLLSN